MRLLIVGAGGHAQVVADAASAGRPTGQWQVVGYLDDNPALQGVALGGFLVLGTLAHRASVAHDAVVIAIGSNLVRRSLFDALSMEHEHLVAVRHPATIIAATAAIGAGTMICAGVIVNPEVRVGQNVILNTGSSLDHHCQIEDHVHIAPGARLGGEVTVGTGALVGIGAVVLPRVRVGAHAIVGGGAVVIRDVPDGTVVGGNPARALSGGSRSRVP